jgi:hypothetical protein
MNLTNMSEKYAKRALIAEKVSDLSAADRANVRKFFAEKSFATTKADIDSYCNMLKESAKIRLKLEHLSGFLFGQFSSCWFLVYHPF